MVNIALYIADTSPSGITRYAFNMTTCLSEFGHQCKIISDTNLFSLNKSEMIVLSENERLGAIKITQRILKLKKEIDRNHIDVVISNGWYHDMVALAASRLSTCKPKIIGVVHTRPELWGLDDKWYKRIKSSLIRRIYALEDKTISVSESLTYAIKNKGWIKDPTTIYNPIVSERIKGISRLRTITDSTLKLVCMGWINPVKGYDTAIKALAELRRNEIPATLTIIGAPNNEYYFSEIKEQVRKLALENYVLFKGALEDPFELLDQMDVFILSSRSEALPTALIEAMAIGLPVIASDCNYGPREILRDGEYGALVPINDWKKIADEARKLVNDPNLYTKMSRSGIERANTFDFVTSGYFYNNLIKSYKIEVG
ncbi:glycosyltransferase [Neobacillus niacini]|uniref:glycosyltransferase n=1 Tax=Neobacillus niacini TaxID=86668 RepID=UPI002FFDE525